MPSSDLRIIALSLAALGLLQGVHRASFRDGAILPATVQASSLPTVDAGTPPPKIVIGFVGGAVHHDDKVHSEVQLADRLAAAYPQGVHVEVFENRRIAAAHETILHLLGAGPGHKLSDNVKAQADIILYGHSWGGAAAVRLAQLLEKDGLPVLLTAEVDVVSKHGIDDALIPPNVQLAVNYYQPDGLLHGRPEIRAADPTKTKILGNFRFSYKEAPIDCPGYPWYDRVFSKTHMEIECDPRVWMQVEKLIREQLDHPGK